MRSILLHIMFSETVKIHSLPIQDEPEGGV